MGSICLAGFLCLLSSRSFNKPPHIHPVSLSLYLYLCLCLRLHLCLCLCLCVCARYTRGLQIFSQRHSDGGIGEGGREDGWRKMEAYDNGGIEGVWIHTCTHACLNTVEYVHAYMHVCMCICVYVCMCVCVYVCIYIYRWYGEGSLRTASVPR